VNLILDVTLNSSNLSQFNAQTYVKHRSLSNDGHYYREILQKRPLSKKGTKKDLTPFHLVVCEKVAPHCHEHGPLLAASYLKASPFRRRLSFTKKKRVRNPEFYNSFEDLFLSPVTTFFYNWTSKSGWRHFARDRLLSRRRMAIDQHRGLIMLLFFLWSVYIKRDPCKYNGCRVTSLSLLRNKIRYASWSDDISAVCFQRFVKRSKRHK
jgi:hypothetical protein